MERRRTLRKHGRIQIFCHCVMFSDGFALQDTKKNVSNNGTPTKPAGHIYQKLTENRRWIRDMSTQACCLLASEYG